ncbi:MAG: hypothetical protein OHK0029_28860 [Armatimonadaceae bacterium]
MAVETQQSLKEVLHSPELERAWHEALASWEDALPAQRSECRADVVALRNHFLGILRDVVDPIEQQVAGVMFYIQLKSQWILLNTQVGYQIAAGRIEQEIFCRASLISALLSVLEPCLNRSDVNRITAFLSQPTGDAVGLPGASAQNGAAPVTETVTVGASDTHLGDAALRDTIQKLQSEIETLRGERLILAQEIGRSEPQEVVALVRRLESELLHKDDVLGDAASRNGHAPGTSPEVAGMVQRLNDATATLQSYLSELAVLKSEREYLFTETHRESMPDVVQHFRDVEDRFAQTQEELRNAKTAQDAFEREFGNLTPKDVVSRTRELSAQVATLQKDSAEMRAIAEYLEREFGSFDANMIVESLHSLRDKVSALESQMARWSTSEELLEHEFGTSDAKEIIARLRQLNDQIASLSQRVGELEAHQALMVQELGTLEVAEIAAKFREMETRIDSFSDIAEMLGSMESALTTLA